MADELSHMPDFRLPDHSGTERTLADLTGEAGLVLYAYPKDDTPGCTLESQDFRDRLDDFSQLGYTVAGISKDSEASHCRFIDKYGLTFPLLSDPQAALLEPLGAWGEKKMYGKVRMGIIRSTYVAAPDGRLLAVYRNVRAKGHADRVLAELSKLAG